MSFVVVSKHSNAKIMHAKDNVELHSGTVVDTCITRPERFAFCAKKLYMWNSWDSVADTTSTY
jgi:hypothetical protein